jgi:hypothetical protein
VNAFEHHDDDDEEDEDFKPTGIRRFILQPGSTKHITWDLIGLFLIAWDCIFIPFLWFNPPKHPFTTTMQWCARIYWTLAMIVYFFIGYVDDAGNVVMRPVQVAMNYLVTWFWLDFALVMLDWIEAFMDSESSVLYMGAMVRSLRMLRTIRLLRMIKANLVWRYLTEQIRSEELILVAHIVKIMISMLIVVHFLACAWYGVGAASVANRSWIEKEDTAVMTGPVQLETLWVRYTVSFHWSLSVFSGETLIFPVNLAERFFTICVLFFAFMFSASLVSVMTTAMTRLEIMSRQQTSQMRQLRQYLVDQNIPAKLSVRVQRNAQHVMLERKRNLPESNVELLKFISEPLFMEIHFEVHSPTLIEHLFFACFTDANPSGIRKVCHTAVSVLSLTEGDVLFSVGDVPANPCMYFLLNGRLRYKQEEPFEPCSVLLEDKSWICEGVLWTHWSYHGTLRAEAPSRLLAIDAGKFQEICSSTPMVQLTRYAEAFVEILNSTEKVYHTDLGEVDENLEDMIAHAFPELIWSQEAMQDQEEEHEEPPKFRRSTTREDRMSKKSANQDDPWLVENPLRPAHGSRVKMALGKIGTVVGLGFLRPGGNSTSKGFHRGGGAALKKGTTSQNLNNVIRHRRPRRYALMLNGLIRCVCCPCMALTALIDWILESCGKSEGQRYSRHWARLLPTQTSCNGTTRNHTSVSDKRYSAADPASSTTADRLVQFDLTRDDTGSSFNGSSKINSHSESAMSAS